MYKFIDYQQFKCKSWVKCLLLFVMFLLQGVLTNAQNVLYLSAEEFPNTYNTGLTGPLSNTTFTGTNGTWTAFSNQSYASVGVVGYNSNWSSPNSLRLKVFAGANAATAQATSPVFDLSSYACSDKVDFGLRLDVSKLSAANTGGILYVEGSGDNGVSWRILEQKTAAQLKASFPGTGYNDVTLLIPNTGLPNLLTNQFRYRIRFTQPAGSTYNSDIFFDDLQIFAYACREQWLNNCADNRDVDLYTKGMKASCVNGTMQWTTIGTAEGLVMTNATKAIAYVSMSSTGNPAQTVTIRTKNSAGTVLQTINATLKTNQTDPSSINVYEAIFTTSLTSVASFEATISGACSQTSDQNPTYIPNGFGLTVFRNSVTGTYNAGILPYWGAPGFGSWEYAKTFSIPTSATDRTVLVTVAIGGLRNNGKKATINVEGGNGEKTVEVRANDAEFGDNITMVTIPYTAPSWSNFINVYTSESGAADNAMYSVDMIKVTVPCTGTGMRIGNKVFRDNNSNNLFDAGDGNIVGATVYLYRDVDNNNVPDGQPFAITQSDAGGNYLFEGLPAGSYIAGVRVPDGLEPTGTTANSSNPDSNTDNDNNGITLNSKGIVLSNRITLTVAGEPTTDGDDNNGNLTLDFGFRANTCVKHTETFPNTFNTGFATSINTSFTGSSGSWWAYSSSNYATVVVTTPYYLPSSSQAIKLVTYNTGGKSTDGTAIATSPVVNASANCCPNQTNLNFTLWTYVSNINDTWSSFSVQMSGDGGTTWETQYTITAEQISRIYGENGKTQLSVPVPVRMQTNNFRYRFMMYKPGYSNYNFYLFIDDVSIGSPKTCATGSIGDRVWIDANTNGTQDVGEVGLAGVTVILRDANGAEINRTTTNASGNYLFSNLPAGEYQVSFVTPAGYDLTLPKQGSDGTRDSDAFGANNFTSYGGGATARGIVLGVGENRTDIDAGYISSCTSLFTETFPNTFNLAYTTPTNGTFTGNLGTYTVASTNGFSGAVVESNGTTNLLKTLSYFDPSGTLSRVTVTSPTVDLVQGNSCTQIVYMTFDMYPTYINTPPGSDSYKVYLDGSGNGGTSWTEMWSMNGADIVQFYGLNKLSTVIVPVPSSVYTSTFRYRLRVEQQSGAFCDNYILFDDFRIRKCACPPLNLGNLVWNDTNTNGIRDAGEPVINGATVRLYQDFNGDNVPDGAAIATTTTNTSGIYNFSTLSAGSYIVGVVLPVGFSGTTTTVNSSNPNSDTDNDNNGVRTMSGELRSNFITLTVGGEPASGVDGDGTNGNLTLDFGLTTAGLVVCSGSNFNPLGPAVGYNGFIQDGVTASNGHTDAGLALGGNLTLNGSIIVGMAESGYYPNAYNHPDNLVLVIGGRINYTSGGITYVNSQGDVKLGNTTGTTIWGTDPNGATVNLRFTSNASTGWTGFNSQPAIHMNSSQTAASATGASGINFTTAFTDLINNANLLASYSATSPCAASLNIINLTGTTPTVNLVANRVNVINVTGTYLNTITSITFSSRPNATTPVIFNINQTSSFTWNGFNTPAFQNDDSRFVLYNFYNNTGTITINNTSSAVVGSVLAPQANVVWNNLNNLEGQLIAKSATINGGELHDQPFAACLPICNNVLTLGNLVWDDLNNNGVRDAGEPGINAATVRLYQDANGDNVPDGAAIATTTTNSSGNYTFTSLFPGNYIVGVVIPSGYTAAITTGTSANPNNDTDNDNNGVTTVSGELRSNFITLSVGGEPLTGVDGDDANGNLTLDFAVRQIVTCPGNIITTNTGFENDFTDWIGIANNTITTDAFSGSKAAQVLGGFSGGFKRQLSAIPGNLYNLRAYAKLNGGTEWSSVGLNFLDASFNLIGSEVAVQVTGTNYTLYQVSGVAPANAVYVEAFGWKSAGTGTARFDDFCLTTNSFTCATNPVLNPGFENNLTNWINQGNASITTDAFAGVRAAQISGGAGGVYQNISGITVGDTYVLKVVGKKSGGTEFTGFGIEFYNSSNVLLASSTSQFTSATFTEISLGLTAPVGTAYANVWAYKNAGSAVYVIDEFNLCRTVNATPLNLGNLVWFDQNNNGLRDAGEPIISGATVNLYADANGDNTPDGTPLQTTVTNGSGIYGFNNLPAGNYLVGVVIPAGYQAGTTTGTSANPNNDTDNDNNGVTTVSGELRSNFITLSVGGEPLSGVDGDGANGNLTLDFGLRGLLNLGNQVWFDANSNGLLDAAETGISGLTVSLYRDNNSDNTPDGTAIATTTTNASGVYAFSNLIPGNYIVGVTLPSGYVATTTTANSANPNSDTDNDNNGVTTVSGELRSNFITLSVGGEPASGVDGDGTNGNLTLDFGVRGTLNVGNLVWLERCNYGMKDAAEIGFSGATVYLYEDKNSDNLPDGAFIASTTSDVNGIYGFANLIPGNYIVGVLLPSRYAGTSSITSSSNPNNDVNNDNNGIRTATGILFSNFITLSVGGEPTTDGDGNNGNLTLDFGIAFDTDGDGVPDIIDIDDDNDGITDVNEHGGFDPLGDCDSDCVPNYLDNTPGSGCPPWTDCNGDGINDYYDWDRDGVINSVDLDSDNDGIPDAQEARPGNNPFASITNGQITGTDADGNGLLSSADNNSGFNNPQLNGLIPHDLDRDGTPNFLDLDSDGDGMTDLTEGLAVYSSTGVVSGSDTDGDGVRGESFGSTANSVADNINGFAARGIVLVDRDGDGKPDAYDIDSDNDGITDNTEGQSTCGFLLPTGTDCNGNGVDDRYDATACGACLRTSGGITPFDKDGDGTPDYRDLDTDNDGVADIYEGNTIKTLNYWTGSAGDADNDGLIDFFDTFNRNTATSNFHRNVVNARMGDGGSYFTGTSLPVGSNTQLPKSNPNPACNVGDRDWRDVMVLPVSLVNFKGNINSNSIAKLSWDVNGEVNMNFYEVERSINGTTYTKVATVNATNTGLATSYTADDNLSNLNSNVVYYRLKMVEKSGDSKYSHVLSFRLGNNGKTSITLAPNPALSYFTIKMNTIKEGTAQIKVVDMLGRILLQQQTSVINGANTFTFNNLTKLGSGTYTVQVVVDGEVFTEKLVIAK